MTHRDVDVLIAGAGLVGLMLANDPAACGVSFRFIDHLPAATTRSKEHDFQSRTLEALDRLKLAEPILEAAQHPQSPFVIFPGKKEVTRLDFSEQGDPVTTTVSSFGMFLFLFAALRPADVSATGTVRRRPVARR